MHNGSNPSAGCCCLVTQAQERIEALTEANRGVFYSAMLQVGSGDTRAVCMWEQADANSQAHCWVHVRITTLTLRGPCLALWPGSASG